MPLPAVLPSSLSAGAQDLYKLAVREGGALGNYHLSKAEPAAIEEMLESGLATRDKNYFRVQTVYANLAYAPRLMENDRYCSYAEVFASRHGARQLEGSDAFLVASLHHALFDLNDNRGGGLSTGTLSVRHPHSTDFEHDSSYLARIELIAPTMTRLRASTLVLHAVLGDFLAYPLGTDLDAVTDDESGNGVCDGEGYHSSHEAHRFMPYQPAEQKAYAKLKGQAVRIELTPEILVDERGELLS